jgi:hypothetical protein
VVTHSLYWPILANGMSYDGTDKLKLRFDDETRRGVVGTMEFSRVIIILQFGRFGGCLFTCLIPFPGSSAWVVVVVVEHPLGGCA